VLASTRSVAYPCDVRYLEFLGRVHELLTGPPYLEIGIRHGDSLALARGPAVGIDPEFELRVALPESVELFTETSDEYFDRKEPLAPLGGRRVGYSFIDGMHLAEFALRDFINVERRASRAGVIVFDDMLPRSSDEAARERHTRAWTGDVYKLLGILSRYRPDLMCLRIGTEPTGLLVVIGLDPDSTVLADHYDEIVAEAVHPDPQEVPAAVLERRDVLDPQDVLDAAFWKLLARGGESRLFTWRLRRSVQRSLRQVSRVPLRDAVPALA
jgi:methyltransferase family protein